MLILVTDRFARAHASLAGACGHDLATTIAHMLERAGGDVLAMRGALTLAPSLPLYEHDAWLQLHGYMPAPERISRERLDRSDALRDEVEARRHASRCRYCKRALRPGQRVGYDHRTGALFCEPCATGTREEHVS